VKKIAWGITTTLCAGILAAGILLAYDFRSGAANNSGDAFHQHHQELDFTLPSSEPVIVPLPQGVGAIQVILVATGTDENNARWDAIFPSTIYYDERSGYAYTTSANSVADLINTNTEAVATDGTSYALSQPYAGSRSLRFSKYDGPNTDKVNYVIELWY